jgi:hypothetical protein
MGCKTDKQGGVKRNARGRERQVMWSKMTGNEEGKNRQKRGCKKTNKGVQKDRQMGTRRTGTWMQEI